MGKDIDMMFPWYLSEIRRHPRIVNDSLTKIVSSLLKIILSEIVSKLLTIFIFLIIKLIPSFGIFYVVGRESCLLRKFSLQIKAETVEEHRWMVWTT